MKRVVIIEDNIPLSEAFANIIDASEDFRVSGIYTNCEDAVDNLKEDKPDIVLMDIELPGINGVEGTKIIRRQSPKTLIMIITVFENSEIVFDALCAGASGYLTKNASSENILHAIKELIAGGAPMSINIAKMVVQSFQKNLDSLLSDRELEVLTLLAQGKSYLSIGESLFISRNTIKYHIKNIYGKLEVNNKEQAIEKATQKKYI